MCFCESRGISWIYLKFVAPLPRKISEALALQSDMTLMNIEKLSQNSKQVLGSCTFYASNLISELRKLIELLSQTNYLCWKSNFKYLYFGFHQVSTQKHSKTLKNNKTTLPAASWFQMFLVFANLVKPLHPFLKQY